MRLKTIPLLLMLLATAYTAFWLSPKIWAQDQVCDRPSTLVTDTMAHIENTKCFWVGVIEANEPMSYKIENNWAGFEIDLASKIAKLLLGSEQAINFQNITNRDNTANRLSNPEGGVDFVIATLGTDTADGVVFSEPYFLDKFVVLVKSNSNISSTIELQRSNVSIAIDRMLYNDLQKRQLNQGFQENLVRVPNLELALKSDTYAGIIELQSHRKRYLIIDPTLRTIDLEVPVEYRIAVRAGDQRWLTAINCALATISKEQTWQELHKELFIDQAPLVINASGCQAESSPTPTDTATSASTSTATETSTLTVTATPTITPLPATITPTPTLTPTLPVTMIESTLQKIHNRGYIIAGVRADVPLFGNRDDETGEWRGFEIDLMREFAKRWLGDAQAVDFVKVTAEDRLTRLASGDVDILAAAMIHAKDRERRIDYSQSYYLDGQNILVKANGSTLPATDAERILWLDGKRIAALKNTRPLQRIKEFALEKGLQIEVPEFDQYDQAVQALLEDRVDAVTTTKGFLLGLQKKHPSLMILLEQNFSIDPYGLGVPSGDSHFADLVNYTLQAIKTEGTYDTLYENWFCQNATRPCNPYPIEIWPGAAPYTFTTAPTLTIAVTYPVVDRLMQNGLFVAGVKYDSPPFGYVTEQGELVGFEVDLMREFARRWLGDANAVELVRVTSSDRITRLLESKIDIIAATMTHNKARDELIDFSQTYYRDGQNILVSKASAWSGGSDDERIQQLNGKQIGAVKNSTSIRQIADFAKKYDIDLEIVDFEQYDQAVQALLDNKIDGVTTDRGILIGFAQQHPDELVVLLDKNFKELDETFRDEPYGLGLRVGDHRFRDLVNFTLQEMKQDGTYDQLYRYWFGISFIMQDQTLDEPERSDLIKRYWTDNVQNPVTMTQDSRISWQPYPIEIWPAPNYFSGLATRNDLAPMVWVPAGPARLGTTAERIQDASQHPGRGKGQLIVELDAFYIDQHEVTNHQYRQCVELGKCTLPQSLGILDVFEYFYGEAYRDHPVVHVTWDQAQQYCTVLGKTLPTEAQWEKAARFTTDISDPVQYLYPWGDDGTDIRLRATYADSAERQDFANPVGIYRYAVPAEIHGFITPIIGLSGASTLGVLDMAGNVQEWTDDCYAQDFYRQLTAEGPEARHNPTASKFCNNPDRTVRSSGYYDSKYTLLTVYRQGKPASSDDRLRGFRCALPGDQTPAARLQANP